MAGAEVGFDAKLFQSFAEERRREADATDIEQARRLQGNGFRTGREMIGGDPAIAFQAVRIGLHEAATGPEAGDCRAQLLGFGRANLGGGKIKEQALDTLVLAGRLQGIDQFQQRGGAATDYFGEGKCALCLAQLGLQGEGEHHMVGQGLGLPLLRDIAQAENGAADQNQEQDPEGDQEPFQKFQHRGHTPPLSPIHIGALLEQNDGVTKAGGPRQGTKAGKTADSQLPHCAAWRIR